MLFRKKLENKTVDERETVILEAEVTKPTTEVKWMKNGGVLQPSANVEMKAEGTKHSLVIKNATCADKGFYSCETLHDKTQAKVNVESKSGQVLCGLGLPCSKWEKGCM